MSFNGSGTFQINTAGQPVVAGTVITATAFNALTADLATGLSTCITKDGQTTATANIPMGGNKLTGLGAGTAATDSARLSQVQGSVVSLLGVTGIDTIAAAASPQLTAYATGQMFWFVAAGTNTGATTLNIDALGAKNITRGTAALAAGDIVNGAIALVVYDGTQFQLLSITRSIQTNGTIASAATTNIGAANAEYLAVSGTTTITAFDNVVAGIYRVLKFDGILTLTYNATSLILPGTASITTAAGDTAGFVSLGSGNWRCEWYQRANGAPVGVVPIANGGTGSSTLAANNVLLGNGTSAVQVVAPGSSGNVLTSNGTTWQSSTPTSGFAMPSGAIMDYAGSSAPSGWLLCFGQAVSRTTYADLFTALGTTYGSGDGSTTFNLPDLRGRVAAGKDDMGGTAASRLTSGGSGITGTTLGASGGTQTHTLTTTEMPAHTHSIQPYTAGCGGTVVPTGVGSGGATLATVNTNATGGGGAHQNTQPTLVLNKIIKL